MKEEKTLFNKLHAIMEAVDYLQRNAENEHNDYTYVNEAKYKEVFHKEFVKHKILFSVSTSNARTIDGDKEKKLLILDVAYRFIDTESGEELTGTFQGSGQARDDKGNYAAVTGAIKYILSSTFLIPTGDDPEDNKNDEPERPIKTPKKEVKKEEDGELDEMENDYVLGIIERIDVAQSSEDLKEIRTEFTKAKDLSRKAYNYIADAFNIKAKELRKKKGAK